MITAAGRRGLCSHRRRFRGRLSTVIRSRSGDTPVTVSGYRDPPGQAQAGQEWTGPGWA